MLVCSSRGYVCEVVLEVYSMCIRITPQLKALLLCSASMHLPELLNASIDIVFTTLESDQQSINLEGLHRKI